MAAGKEKLHRVPARPVRRGFFILPNLLTTAGLLCGFYSMVACMRGQFALAAIAIMAANFFDVLDGRVARVTKTTSEFGSQYDSLADLVAFGVAPAFLFYRFALEPWGTFGWLAAALYVVCGALRLARFNVQRDEVTKRYFVGLPIPAAAEVIASAVLLYVYLFGTAPTLAEDVTRRFGWLLMCYALSILMVSNVRYFSFKEFGIRHRQSFSVLVGVILTMMIFLAEPQLFLFIGFAGYALSGPVRSVLGLSMSDGRDGDNDNLTGQDDSSSVLA